MPIKIDTSKSLSDQLSALRALRERRKLIITKYWDEINNEAHDKAFTVAKVMCADILQDIYDYVYSAIKEGWSYDDFKERVRNGGLAERMQKAGWIKADATDEQISSRLHVIIDTNVKMSYGKGNYKRLMLVKDKKPYWIYHQTDRKTKRIEHAKLNGRKFHCDDPIWNTIYPPSAFRCSCWVEAVAEPDGVENGEDVEIKPGEHPISPLTAWKPETTKYVEGIGKALEGTLRMKEIGSDTDWVQDIVESIDNWEELYDLDCDLFDKPMFSNISDAISFNKTNNKTNNRCTKRHSNQPNWQDYGLKTHQAIENASMEIEPLNLNLKDAKGLEDVFYKEITNGTNKDYKIKTRIQELTMNRNLVIHTLYRDGKLYDPKRARYSHCVLPTLLYPDEIWETETDRVINGEREKKIRYFKVFKVKNAKSKVKSVMVAVTYNKLSGAYVSTIVPRKTKYSNDFREGKLLYAEPHIIGDVDKYNDAINKYKK